VLVVLALILIWLFILLFQQYNSLRRERILNERAIWMAFASRHTPLPPTEATVIQPWMTFDYINRLFALPRDYLQIALKIKNPHYPQIPLYHYAATQHINSLLFTDEVRNLVQNYQPPAAQ
jgi:hypothetical protein